MLSLSLTLKRTVLSILGSSSDLFFSATTDGYFNLSSCSVEDSVCQYDDMYKCCLAHFDSRGDEGFYVRREYIIRN